MSTFVIAEAGSNHNRQMDTALRLIDAAVNSRADAVKFQTFKSDRLFSRFTPDFANYDDILGLLKRIELPREWQKDLFQYCESKGVEFMSTPFDEEAISQLYNLGVKRMKIAGFECQDPRFIKEVAATKLPLVISLGIGVGSNSPARLLDHIKEVFNWVYSENDNPDITMLHCNNAYPTPFEDINLTTMVEMNNLIHAASLDRHIKIGLSDHTIGTLIPPVAVGMGAQCIEKHFTLSRTLPGPDHSFAIEPYELHQMVCDIRKVERSKGTKRTKYTPSETSFAVGTRVVVAKTPIAKGDKLRLDNTTTKRGKLYDSIPAKKYFQIIDDPIFASKDFEEDEVITWGQTHIVAD